MSISPSSEETTLEGTALPVADPQAEGDPAAPEIDYIRLNPKELSNEIKRLNTENKEFLRIYNSHVGDTAKRKYEPEIRARESQIEDLKTEIRRRDIQAMEPSEIEAKFESDPEFAIEYAKLIHHKPQVQTAPVDETPQILSAWEQMMGWAKSKGISADKIEEVTRKAADGEYGSDDVHWSIALQRVQSELADELVSKNGKNPGSTVNSELTKNGPDLTGASRGIGSSDLKSLDEFKKLTSAEQRKILNEPEGEEKIQALIRAGK